MGIKNLKVLPDSRQFKTVSPVFFISKPVTIASFPEISIPDPRAFRQSIVARISSENESPFITLSPFARAEQIKSLCESLFDGGAFIVPSAFDGSMRMISRLISSAIGDLFSFRFSISA